MRTLSLGIFAEGPSDVAFLSAVLARYAARLLESKARHPAQIADVDALPGRPSLDTFRDAITRHATLLDIVVVHADANGDVQRAMQERIDPLFDSVKGIAGSIPGLIEIVPMKETEAWMLCDFHAIGRVLGTKKQRHELGLPSHAREVERIPDPKAALREAQVVALGRRSARKVGVGPLYSALGQEVSFGELDKVPAFARFSSVFESALRELGFLP